MKDILVKCGSVEFVKAGFFKEPELQVKLTDVCLKSLIIEVGLTDLLDEIDKCDIAEWLECRGFTVTEN